jgi:hypothetical protein
MNNEHDSPFTNAGRAAFEEFEAYNRNRMSWDDLHDSARNIWENIAAAAIRTGRTN